LMPGLAEALEKVQKELAALKAKAGGNVEY
jgi:hypothetical protein